MAWIEKREGSNNYMACWKQNGKKIRKSTGVPISGKPGMPPNFFCVWLVPEGGYGDGAGVQKAGKAPI